MKWPKITPGRAAALFALAMVVAVLLGYYALAHAAELTLTPQEITDIAAEVPPGAQGIANCRRDTPADVTTTDGNTLTLNVNASGYYRISGG